MDGSFDEKSTVGDEIGLYFEPEAIHVMRFDETEEEFDKRLESYTEDESRWKIKRTRIFI